ncbi:MAG: glycosyltransferase family 39 protein [Saprospiraceae bacterium]|nr:glycosyltransferase family 39 protein [Saprospiraceae bacterium]
MKNNKKAVSKPKPQASGHVPPPFKVSGITKLEQLNHWLGKRKYWVIGSLIFILAIIRISLFDTVANGPLYTMYSWQESDSNFFDEQARTLVAGDWLSSKPLHPFHGWHRDFATTYFKQHPEKLNQILAASPVRDTTFAQKQLWNEWYGGNTYHQEPLYAYMLAMLYAITGNGIYWMIVLQALVGIASGFLLWRITRRYFDDTVAAATGLLYALCGIVLFQETLILRTTWSVFFTLLTVLLFQRALDQRTKSAFFISGIAIGLAYLLQSFFILFLIGSISIYLAQERKMTMNFARNAALLFAGFFVMFLPVIFRNASVGAPLFSTSSTGAITFVATNVQNTNAVSRWQPEAAKCAEIMGATNGKFIPATIASVKTHSIGSFTSLLWNKVKTVINGSEWPNNENYYFYREVVPVLKWTFIDFYWIAALGIPGLLFALYARKKFPALYLGILLHLAIMIGFYVLGRLRAPLAVLMLPFASYCVVECLRFTQNGQKNTLIKIAVVAFCAYVFAYQFYPPNVNRLDTTDYNTLYETAFFDRVKNSAEAKNMSDALAAHSEFLTYEPEYIKSIKANQIIKIPSEIELLDYFANHHQIHSFLYEDSGNQAAAAKEMQKHNLMKSVVENSRRRASR